VEKKNPAEGALASPAWDTLEPGVAGTLPPWDGEG
jgi:hypothetical protein